MTNATPLPVLASAAAFHVTGHAGARPPRYFWTAPEERILREHYPRGGVPACAPLLPARAERAIYTKAHALGLHKPNWVKDLSYQRYGTSEQIDSIIRREYAAAKKGYVARIARMVRRPDWWVTMRAARLGLVAPRFKAPPWSATEDEIIAPLAHLHPGTIVKRLKSAGYTRTETAVVIRLKRLGQPTGRNADLDRYSANGLAVLLGADRKTIARWIAAGQLKASRAGTARTMVQHGDEYRIHRRDVKRFIIENAAIIDIRKVEKTWFIELLTGRD